MKCIKIVILNSRLGASSYFYNSNSSTLRLKFNHIKIIDFLILFILILFAGLRYNTGTDFGQLHSYYTIYSNFPFMDILKIGFEEFELVKWFIIAIILSVTNNVQMVFILLTLLFIIPLFKALYNNSNNYQYSILGMIFMGFYTLSFNIMWQMAAASVMFFAVSLLLRKQYMRFFFFTIIAIGLHTSVIFAVPVIFALTFIKPNFRNIIVIMLAFLILFFNPNFLNFFYSIWSDYSNYGDYRGTDIGLYLQLIVWLCFLALFLFFKSKLISINEKNGFYIMCVVMSVMLILVGTQNVIIDRVSIYFKMYILYLFPALFSIFKGKEKLLVMYIITVVLFIWYIFYLNYNGVIPYKSILFK